MEGLADIGFDSLSSFSNNMDLLIVLIILTFVHWIISWIPKDSHDEEEPPQRIALYKNFTYGVYIRLFLQAFQFIIIGSISEIYNLDVSTTSRMVSFCISCLFLVSSIILLILSLSFLFKSTNRVREEKKHNKLQEFNSGLK